MCQKCKTESAKIGDHPKYGALCRCKHCNFYWVFQSNRLWQHESESGNSGYSIVYFGAGEMGLANAVLCGCTLNKEALEQI